MVKASGSDGGVMVSLTQTEHGLNATAYLSIATDHLSPFVAAVHPSSNGYFQQDNTPRHEGKLLSLHDAIMSTWSRIPEEVSRALLNPCHAQFRLL